MAWVRLDDGFAEHPKIEEAGPLAAWLHVAALCYCNRHLTDGFIPAGKVKRLADVPNVSRHIGALVKVGMWMEVEGGYAIHDYLQYQPSRDEVEKGRAEARRRSAMNADPELRRALRARDGDNCRYCGTTVNWRDRRGPNGGTYDHVHPMSKGGDESLSNLVVCCRQCNLRKGDRTLDQAGMSLLPPGSNLDGGVCVHDNPARPDPSVVNPPTPQTGGAS